MYEILKEKTTKIELVQSNANIYTLHERVTLGKDLDAPYHKVNKVKYHTVSRNNQNYNPTDDHDQEHSAMQWLKDRISLLCTTTPSY